MGLALFSALERNIAASKLVRTIPKTSVLPYFLFKIRVDVSTDRELEDHAVGMVRSPYRGARGTERTALWAGIANNLVVVAAQER